MIFDNLCNSNVQVINCLEQLIGKRPIFVEGDIRDKTQLERVFSAHAIDAVMHFAGLKAVAESIEKPLDYYDNNVKGTINLVYAMLRANVKTLVFSSSATVYGNPEKLPISEDAPCSATNPYGRSKLIIESFLTDLHRADAEWRIACLRYFNPVGAHQSGLIGENPQRIPNNLMPFIAQVAIGKRDFINIWGNDYSTPDGTGIRDYIHVVDLAEGHVKALNFLNNNRTAFITVNLGTGQGYSVLNVIKAFEKVSGRHIEYRIAPRRDGDIAKSWADPSLAHKLLAWKAQYNLYDMCTDVWRWQKQSHHPGNSDNN